MTKPLDGFAFRSYVRRLHLPRETQDLLATIRSAPPHRLPDNRAGNMPVWYPSTKMQCIIKAESAKVEFAFLLEAEHDDDVLEYFDQPPPIRLEYADRLGRTQHPLHTADYFVFRYASAGWEECKPIDKLTQYVQKQSTRYVLDEHGVWRCPPGEAFAAQYGLTYQVRASDQINWNAQDNWLYLEDYYQDLERLSISGADLTDLYRIVDKHPGITLADLRTAAVPIRSDTINIALAKRALYADFSTYRLTEPERMPIFRDHKEALAQQPSRTPEDSLNAAINVVALGQGGQVLWNGKPWRVATGDTTFTLVSPDGVSMPLLRSAFNTLVADGSMTIIKPGIGSSITDEGQILLRQAREVDLATAVFRDRVIYSEQHQDEEQRALQERISAVPERTKRRWERSYEQAEGLYGSGFIGLLPHFTRRGSQKRRHPEIDALIEAVLSEHYDNVIRKPKRGAYGEYVSRSREKHVPTISERTFSKYVRNHKTVYDQVLLREGRRAAYAFKEHIHRAEQTTSRHGSYAWSIAHIDHLEIDLQLCDSKTGQPLGKCWLTLMVLTNPRRIAAVYLTFDPPSYRSCMMVVRLCVKRYGRLPAVITVDGGTEFRSVYFEQLLALYSVRKQQRPSAEPRFGSVLERLFGTMNTSFLYHLLGNTQATKRPRTVTKATDPERHAVWTLPRLAQQVQHWADETYDTILHPALKMSPREAYAQSMVREGERAHKYIPYDEQFIKATLPSTKKGTARVQPGMGIRMRYLNYWCDEMRDPGVEGTQVAVRYDPFDITVGYAWIDKQWRKCFCVADELAGCSEREMQLLAAEIHRRNRLLYGKDQTEITQKLLADFRRTNSGTEVLLRQQQHDRESQAALRVLEGQEDPSAAGPPVFVPNTEVDIPRSSIGVDDTLHVLKRLHI